MTGPAPAPETFAVEVQLFAVFREIVGAGRVELPVRTGDRVSDLWRSLAAAHPRLAAMQPSAAVNAEFTSREHPLAPGDQVAFLPPVSGG